MENKAKSLILESTQEMIALRWTKCYFQVGECLRFLQSPWVTWSNCGHMLSTSLALPFSIFALKHEWHKMTMPQQQSYGFSSSHVWMWELDHKEDWVPENECFQIVVLEKTLEGPLDCKEIKAVNPKRNQPWMFIRRTDAEAEVLMLWPPDVKSWLIGKNPDAGKNWRQEEKRW